MPWLTAHDYKAALDFVGFAAEVEGTDAFPEPVLDRLRQIVPCDAISYGDYSGPARRRRAIRIASAGAVSIPPAVAEAMDALRGSPLVTRMCSAGRAVRQSDLVSRRQLRRTPLYQEVARPLGIEHTMELWLGHRDGIIGGFTFDSTWRDFADRDKQLLEVLVPQLVRLHRAARSRSRRAGESAAADALTPRELEIVRLVADGLTTPQIAAALTIAPGTVRKHVENALGKLGVRTRAAAVRLVFGAPDEDARP
jgi:DNA-binding CsgD family transcriptional regulator